MRTAVIFALVLSASPAFALTDQQWADHKANVDRIVAAYEKRCKEAETKEAIDLCYDQLKAYEERNFKTEQEIIEGEMRNTRASIEALDQVIAQKRHEEMMEAIRQNSNNQPTYYCGYVGNGQSICNPQ